MFDEKFYSITEINISSTEILVKSIGTQKTEKEENLVKKIFDTSKKQSDLI